MAPPAGEAEPVAATQGVAAQRTAPGPASSRRGGSRAGSPQLVRGPELDLLEHLSDAVVVADDTLVIRYANPSAHRLAGYRPGGLQGCPVSVLVPADLLPSHLRGVARSRAGEHGPLLSGPALQTRLLRADGTVTDVELTVRAVEGRDGALRYLAALRPLSELSLLSEAMLGAVGDGVYGLDREGRVQFVNPAALKLTGYTSGEQLGQNQHELLHHHRRDGTPFPAAECPVMAVLRDGLRREILDDVFWTASGEPLEVDYTASPIRTAGEVSGVVVSFREAAQRQRLERNRLLEATAEAQRRVIHELHRAIFPEEPVVAGYQVEVEYRPAGADAPTGGDLYDWAVLPDGTLHLCLVDVAGHDVTATKHALAAVYTIRSLVIGGVPLDELLDRASGLLETHTPELTATALVVHLDPASGRYALHSAGHPPPLYLPAHGAPSYHEPQGTPLGAPRPGPTPAQEGRLRPGDTLLAYTDGLVEGRGDLVEGMAALLRAVSRGRPDPSRLAEVLTAGATHADDTLQVILTRRRAGSPGH